jgi:hypothetical protein
VDHGVLGQQRQERLEIVGVEGLELALDDVLGGRCVAATPVVGLATRN